MTESAVAVSEYEREGVPERARLGLYYQLERICGRRLVTLYNIANGLMFCVLAGSMITVAATALGVWFGFAMPELNAVIWTGGDPLPGQVKFTFWHTMFFAWFCNMAMHIGRNDHLPGVSGVSVTGPIRPESSGSHLAAVNSPSGPRFCGSRAGMFTL